MNEFVDVDSLATNPALKDAVEFAKKHRSTIHIIGLMSDGGISSNIKDTIKIIEYLKTQKVKVMGKMWKPKVLNNTSRCCRRRRCQSSPSVDGTMRWIWKANGIELRSTMI